VVVCGHHRYSPAPVPGGSELAAVGLELVTFLPAGARGHIDF